MLVASTPPVGNVSAERIQTWRNTSRVTEQTRLHERQGELTRPQRSPHKTPKSWTGMFSTELQVSRAARACWCHRTGVLVRSAVGATDHGHCSYLPPPAMKVVPGFISWFAVVHFTTEVVFICCCCCCFKGVIMLKQLKCSKIAK